MSKNSQFTFSANPSVTMRRTKFQLGYNKLMSANMGTLYPFYFEEVLPGDSFKVHSKILSRITTALVKPAFANIFLDVYYFFVPSRICYDKWVNIFGENTEGHWANVQSYSVPKIPVQFRSVASENKVVSGSVADYLEVPLSTFQNGATSNKYISALPFRAFALIYNDWFRDENYMDPVAVSKGELNSLSDEYLNGDAWSVNNYTGMLPKVSKFHDYMTSLLPSPQKGNAVDVLSNTFLPLSVTNSLSSLGGVPKFNNGDYGRFLQVSSSGELRMVDSVGFSLPQGSLSDGRTVNYSSGSSGGIPFSDTNINVSGVGSKAITDTNLGVTFPNSLNVNDLRLAFQTQKILERDARGGTRYVEYIKSAFGVSSPDARLQRPEFLGGKRLTIGISQVAQTTGASEKELGSLGGYSLSDGDSGFSKAFVEAGYVIGVLCYRQYHSYSQGLDERMTRFDRFDFYDPALAHLGEVAVPKSVLYAGASSDQILGYAPIWTSYRYHNNAICGQMRSDAENSLDVWHIGDEYSNVPTMNAQFLEETPNFLDRVLAVDSSVQDQFILDIYNQVEAVRVMPAHSIPGLIDHY